MNKLKIKKLSGHPKLFEETLNEIKTKKTLKLIFCHHIALLRYATEICLCSVAFNKVARIVSEANGQSTVFKLSLF